MRILWPILASVTAIVLHWLINVPSRPYQERTPKARAAVVKPGPNTATPKLFQSRSATKLRLLQSHWTHQPFDNEPEDKHFETRHEAILTNAIAQLRTKASEEIDMNHFAASVQCRTVRCRFEVCGSKRQLSSFMPQLKDLSMDNQGIWRTFSESIKKESSGKNNASCRQVIVSLVRDLSPRDSVTIPNPNQPSAAQPNQENLPKNAAEDGRSNHHATGQHRQPAVDR